MLIYKNLDTIYYKTTDDQSLEVMVTILIKLNIYERNPPVCLMM